MEERNKTLENLSLKTKCLQSRQVNYLESLTLSSCQSGQLQRKQSRTSRYRRSRKANIQGEDHVYANEAFIQTLINRNCLRIALKKMMNLQQLRKR
jgi:hypothetical protein